MPAGQGAIGDVVSLGFGQPVALSDQVRLVRGLIALKGIQRQLSPAWRSRGVRISAPKGSASYGGHALGVFWS